MEDILKLAKETTYKKEDEFLSEFAQKSKNTRGREKEEKPCPVRTDFQRDRDRIIHSKAFRRLKNKTQVFLSPEGDHYRTRLTHTLDVSQIARTISRSLSLNEDLTEAIALGHDLGHTPFGHMGERILTELTGHFCHNEQSLRVVKFLENDGEGLNLTYEVMDGILNHRSATNPMTLEGQCVRLADKIAYLNHDIDDAIRAGILTNDMIPESAKREFGHTFSERINTMIISTVENSYGKEFVRMDEEKEKALMELRNYMFSTVYNRGGLMDEEKKATRMLTELYNFYKAHPDKMPELFIKEIEKFGLEISLCDYISSMSDTYAVQKFSELYIPNKTKL